MATMESGWDCFDDSDSDAEITKEDDLLHKSQIDTVVEQAAFVEVSLVYIYVRYF
jgi:hypothetical protein